MKKTNFLLPEHWAGFLINGDEESLTVTEKRQLKTWLDINQPGECMGIVGSEAFFYWNHDAIEMTNLGCNCLVYCFIK
jgi:hypothetical protein